MEKPYPVRLGVEAFPVEDDGQKLICIRDSLSFAPAPLFVNYPTYLLIAMLDGENGVADIQKKLAAETGVQADAEQIESLVEQLDQNYFLQSPRFERRRNELEGAFLSSPVRASALAGASYESDPEALRKSLGEFFEEAGGLAPISGLRGLIAPHIDLRCGGKAFAEAYRRTPADEIDTFVIFGTAHYGMAGYLGFTRKDFETPLGVAKTDLAFVEAAAEAFGESAFDGELAHRLEHSIEFQVVFLQYVMGNRPFRIVPVLCGSFHQLFEDNRQPLEEPAIRRTIEAMRAFERENGRRALYIAGADLSHVGQKFGDREAVTPEFMREVENEDRALLDAATRMDAEAFFNALARDNDRRRVCGASPIYMTLNALDGAAKGDLAAYDRMEEPATGSCVTFASVTFS